MRGSHTFHGGIQPRAIAHLSENDRPAITVYNYPRDPESLELLGTHTPELDQDTKGRPFAYPITDILIATNTQGKVRQEIRQILLDCENETDTTLQEYILNPRYQNPSDPEYPYLQKARNTIENTNLENTKVLVALTNPTSHARTGIKNNLQRLRINHEP